MSARDATHYQGEVEVIDAIEAWGLGYRLGNAVKYIARANRKGSRRADLIKARDYIERELTGEWPEPLEDIAASPLQCPTCRDRIYHRGPCLAQ